MYAFVKKKTKNTVGNTPKNRAQVPPPAMPERMKEIPYQSVPEDEQMSTWLYVSPDDWLR